MFGHKKKLLWDKRFLRLALHIADWSLDPSTKVGSVIVNSDKQIISTGFNGFSRGIKDTSERLNNRDEKMKLVVHGEMNAILAASKIGISLKNCSLYLIARDTKNGQIWGSAPCTRCSVELIQSGIIEVVSIKGDPPERWKNDCDFAKSLLQEAGIKYREVEFNA